MSSRQRRLVDNSKNDLLAAVEGGAKDDSSAEEETSPTVVYSNPYSLLEQTQADHPSSSEEQESTISAVQEEASRPVTAKKRRQRGRRKKNKNQKPQANDEDDIDKLISDLHLDKDAEEEVTELLINASKASALQVKVKSLRGDEELSRIFGASVVANVEAELERKRRKELGIQNHRGTRNSHRFLRKFILTTPNPDWDFPDSTLTMDFRGTVEDGQLFEFVGSVRYIEDHKAFLACQDIGDPNVLASFSNRHPYHVESLLAMYDLLMATGSALHAEECLKRALFILELSWNREFSPLSDKCRLNYKMEINRPFFLALFRHIQQLSKRGCLQTSFECCKFLLSLDRSDPLGVLCMIDYLAIRAGKFDFIPNLINELEDGPGYAIRPGLAFSLAYSKMKMGEESNESLVQAILMHPLALFRLMGKIKDKGVRLCAEWEFILRDKYFLKADDGGSASLNHLVNLFVERHHMIYKPQEVLDWLKEGCQKALEARANKNSLTQDATADDWECVRINLFPPDERNEFRDLHLYDFSDEVNQLPEDVLHGGGGFADVEARMAQELGRQRIGGRVVHLRDEDLRQANPLAIFLQSVLPWVQRDTPNEQD